MSCNNIVCVSNNTEPVSLPCDQGNVAGISEPPIASAFPVASAPTTEPDSLPYDQGNVGQPSKPPIASAFPVISTPIPAFNPVVVAFAQPEMDVEDSKKPPAMRMEELEGMKRFLSQGEYQRKRAEILSAV